MTRKLTFEDLERDPFHARLIQEAQKNLGGGPLPDEIKEWMVNMSSWSDTVARQHSEWIRDLNYVAKRISTKQECSSDFGIFWIRLHGLFSEIRDYFGPGTIAATGTLGKQIAQLITRARSKFTDDEFLWIEHERMCHCHVAPTYYRKSINKGKDGKYRLKDDYSGLDIDELDARLKTVIKPYAGNSRPLAKAFSDRILLELGALETASAAWIHSG